MTTSPPIDWPTGGFEWTEELRAKLPIIRGIRVTDPKPPTGAWTKPPRLTEPLSDYYAGEIKDYLDSRAKRGLPPAAKPWTESEAQARLNADALRNSDWEYWQELALQFFYKSRSGADFPWALEAALELHGPVFATRWLLMLGLEFHEHAFYLFYYNWKDSHSRLREALAYSSEDDYRTALQVAADYRGQSDQLDLLTSYLFPDQTDWAEQSAAHQIPYHWEYMLDHLILLVEVAKKDGYDSRIWEEISPSAALLHIYRQGEAALPILAVMFDRQHTASRKLAFLSLIVQLRTPGLIPTVVARFDNKQTRATLDKLAERWPAACLVSALERAATGRFDELDGWITRLALRQPQAVESALAACSPEARARGADLVKPQSAPEEAPAEALPEVLRNPPWTSKDRPKPLPVLELVAPPQPEAMVWSKGVRERWLRLDSEDFQNIKRRLHGRQEHEPDFTMDRWGLWCMDVKESAHHRAYAGEPLRPEDFEAYKNPEFLMWMRPKTAQAVWAGIPAKVWRNWSLDVLQALFAQGDMAALPRILDYVDSLEYYKTHGNFEKLSILLPVRAHWWAPLAAWALRNNLKHRVRSDGIAWLRAHPETAITALIPPALGKPGSAREDARAALRWLAEDGKEEELRRIATGYGADAAAAVDALLKTDPLWIVPAKPPKLPAFFVPAAFHRPRLNGGGALPLTSVAHLGTMLAISRLDEPYAGLAQVKAACTSDSLSNFTWDVFEAWMAAGAPSKEDWAFTALALLGDDETARRLTPLLAQWSRHGAHARATAGLDMLVVLGTDVAMQRLSTLVDNKAASEQLRNKARQRLADVAQDRGLSEEELADWLVPDLELNANGTLALDFGPRQFMVGFDEALRPWVRDAAGVQLKTLPKPIQSDDPDAARAATQRFNALKKDAKAIAKQHIERLAKAMTNRRRWTPATFRMLFMEHPVMCHLARRLVWGVYRDDELLEAFRVAEDSSLADRHDAAYALPDAGAIGLVMAAELSEELYRAFGQIFADYEIIQPFKQLGRELYRPNKTEQKSGEVTRFVDKKVNGGSLNALANRGWRRERGPAFYKPLDGGLTVVLEAKVLNSHSGSEWGEPDHEFGKLFVRRDGSDAQVAVTELTPLAFSEAMRDVALLPVLKPQ